MRKGLKTSSKRQLHASVMITCSLAARLSRIILISSFVSPVSLSKLRYYIDKNKTDGYDGCEVTVTLT